MTNVFEDINQAQVLLQKGCTDEAEAMIAQLEKKLFLLSKAEQAADDDQEDDSDDDSNGNDMEDDGDEDDGDGDMNKSFRQDGITYPRSTLDYALERDHTNLTLPVNRPRSDADPYRTGTWPVVQAPRRHDFDNLVDGIVRRDGSSRTAAMVTARLENPALYTQYQQAHALDRNTSEQTMARGDAQNDVAKLGLPKTPPLYPQSEHESTEEGGKKKVKSHRRPVRHHDQKVKTFEDVVANLVGKGHRLDIARQITKHLYGATLPHAEIQKHADLRERFESRVAKIMRRDKCDRLDAMRKAREERADDYLAYQLS
jgi:hypothetical protein